MHKRCYHPKTNNYKYYGGKGIKVSEDWNVYQQFISDMGPKPELHYSLDRIDSNGNYCKENCRWIPIAENERRRSNNTQYEYQGKMMFVKEIAKALGFAESTLSTRIKKWGFDEAINRPRHPTGPKRKGRS